MLSNPNLDLVSRFVRLPLAQQKLFYQRVQAKGMSFARLPIPQTRQEMDNLPLSYAQERQWFLWQLEPESSAYHIPTALRLRGRLDIASLQRSFAALVERHESLRTRIARMGDEWVQVVSADVSLALEVEVQRGLDEQRLLERVEAEIARPFDLEQGPLLRVTLLEVDADEHVLVMVQHHIVSDGWSMQLMVEELVQLYAGYSQGLDVVLPALPIQYADYALWQRSWMEAGEKERQLAYWTGLLGGEQRVLSVLAPGKVGGGDQDQHRGKRGGCENDVLGMHGGFLHWWWMAGGGGQCGYSLLLDRAYASSACQARESIRAARWRTSTNKGALRLGSKVVNGRAIRLALMARLKLSSLRFLKYLVRSCSSGISTSPKVR